MPYAGATRGVAGVAGVAGRRIVAGDMAGAQDVCIARVEADAGIAEVIRLELADRGVQGNLHGESCPASRTCIAVMSPDAARDLAWRATIARHLASRVVPVSYRDVRRDELPDGLPELNWLKWDLSDPERFYAQLNQALLFDPVWHDRQRVLENEAHSWQAGGRADYLLLGSAERAKAAMRHLRAADGTGPSQAEHLKAYVRLSLRSARKTRRKRVRKNLYRVVMVVLLATLVYLTKTALQRPSQDNYLAGNLSSTVFDNSRPDRVGLLGAALALQSQDARSESLGQSRMLDALSRPWSLGVLGQGKDDGAITAAAMTSDGSHVYAGEGDGFLGLWDARTDRPVWRRAAVSGRVDQIATSGDGAILLGESSRTLTLVNLSPWRVRTVTVPTAVNRLAVLASGRGWIAATGNGDIYTVSPTLGLTKIVTSQTVLALSAMTDGSAQALVRDTSTSLELVSVPSGNVLARAPWPAYQLEAATIAPDGSGVDIVGAGGRVWYASSGLTFAPSGFSVPDLATVLTALPGHRLVLGSSQYGVSVADLSRRIKLGQVCLSLEVPTDVVAAADGDRIACLDDVTVDLWSTAQFNPVSAPASGTVHQASVDVMVGRLRVVGLATGSFRVFGLSPSGYLSGLGTVSPVSDVAIRSDGHTFALGGQDGEVLEVDMAPGQTYVVSRWQEPSHNPISVIDWSADGSQLLVGAADGTWWGPPSCSGCALSGTLPLQRVRNRLWGCYSSNQISELNTATRRYLDVRNCQSVVGS